MKVRRFGTDWFYSWGGDGPKDLIIAMVGLLLLFLWYHAYPLMMQARFPELDTGVADYSPDKLALPGSAILLEFTEMTAGGRHRILESHYALDGKKLPSSSSFHLVTESRGDIAITDRKSCATSMPSRASISLWLPNDDSLLGRTVELSYWVTFLYPNIDSECRTYSWGERQLTGTRTLRIGTRDLQKKALLTSRMGNGIIAIIFLAVMRLLIRHQYPRRNGGPVS